MTECPSNTKGSGYHGIFYISPEASGTVIEGFDIGFNKNNQVDGRMTMESLLKVHLML